MDRPARLLVASPGTDQPRSPQAPGAEAGVIKSLLSSISISPQINLANNFCLPCKHQEALTSLTDHEFETERLAVRELREGDLGELLKVYTSNPAYLDLTDDRHDLERDLALAQMVPGRKMAGIFCQAELIGVLDWLEMLPSAWAMLLMIRADRQRQGLASEALGGLLEHLCALGATSVLAGVNERNPAGHALAHRLGFGPASASTMRMVAWPEGEIEMLERPL